MAKDAASGEREPEVVEKSRSARGSRWVTAAVSGLLLVLVLFGSYYFTHIAARRHNLDQHYVRSLSRLGQNFAATTG